MRARTLTASSSETPTCVTALKRRSRRISQQMLALLSAHSVKDEHQLKSVQTESQSWSSPMASRGTLTTMGTTNGLHRTALDRNDSGDILDYYAGSDAQRGGRSMAYPPQLNSGHRSRAQRHTPKSSYSSSKYSREAPTQPLTSPTKPMGPRAPNQTPSIRTVDDHRTQRRPHASTGTDAHHGTGNRRVPVTDFELSPAEYSPHSSSAALSLRNPSSAPPSTSRYPPEAQSNSLQARRGPDRNARLAIVAPQDASPSLYPNSAVPTAPTSAPAFSTRPPSRSKTAAERGTTTTTTTTTTGRFHATPLQATHHRTLSDGVAGGPGLHIEPRRTPGPSSARPRSPRDGGIVAGGTTQRAEQQQAHPLQSSGSDYSDSGQYAVIDNANTNDNDNAQPQHASSPNPPAPVPHASREPTSFDIDVDRPPAAAPFSLGAAPRSLQRLEAQTPADPARAEATPDDREKAKADKAKASSQGADLRGSIAELWTSAVEAAEEAHRLEQLQKSSGPLSATSITSPTYQTGSSYVLPPSESLSSPGSTPHLLKGLHGRPGSRGRENQPQAPAIVHSSSSSSYSHSHSHSYHVTVSIPPVVSASQAGPPPRYLDITSSSPPPPRPPARVVAYGPVPVTPSIASAHGSTSSIAPKRPPGSRDPSPHKSPTPPSPARPPPPPLARSPSPSKPPPPLPLPVKFVPAPREASSQSPIKSPVSLPLSPASNNTDRLSVFRRGSTSPVKPPAPLPSVVTSSAAARTSPVKPPVPLPDPTAKPRALSPPPPPVKPLQLRTKNINSTSNNSPLPPPPMQLPPVPPLPTRSKENSQENTNISLQNADHAVPPSRSRPRLPLPRVDSDCSIVAVSVVSTKADDDSDEEETKHGEVGVQVEVPVQGMRAVDKPEEHVESSESEYSGNESQCVSVPRIHHPGIKASTDTRSLRGSASASSPKSESKVTSSTVAVAPTPSKLQLGDKTADGSPGSLHIREAAESMFLQLHRVVNVGVEQAEVTTPTNATSEIEGLDATPTPSNFAGAGHRGKVEPPAPVPLRRKEEVVHPASTQALYQLPPKSQLLDEPTVDLRPISLGFLKDEDIVFNFSEAEHIRLDSDLTIDAPTLAVSHGNNHRHNDARHRAPSPQRPASGKRPALALKDVPPMGHTRRRGDMSSSGSEYEGDTHGNRTVRSPDFGNPFATPSSSSRPTTANTTTTSSASATGHGGPLGWGPPPRKRNTHPDRRASKRRTIVARYVDGSNLGFGVEGDDEDTGEDDGEDDDDFEVETEHGRVLRKLVKEKSSWPSAMSFRDVTSESTTAARARGYATKLNELAQEDCGLKDWIEIWLKPKLLAGQLDIQPSGAPAHGRVTSGASVFSSTTFPMRFDAFRAIDLTPGAGGGPTELGNGPPPLPYPSLAMKQLQQGSSYNLRSNTNSSNNLLPQPKKSTGFFSSLGRKASMKSKVPGDSSGQENREKERVRRKLSRAPPSGSSTSQLGHYSDIGLSSKASLLPLAPSIVGGPRAPPGKPKRASTVLVIGPPQLIHPPPPAQYPPNMSKRTSLDAFIAAATSSSSTVAPHPHQPMSFQPNVVPPAPEGPRPVTRTPSFPGHSSSSSSLNRGNGLTPPDGIIIGPERRTKFRQAVSYQPPKQPSDGGHFEKNLDKLCDFMPDLEREVLAGYLRRADGQEMKAIGRIVDDRKSGAIAWP